MTLRTVLLIIMFSVLSNVALAEESESLIRLYKLDCGQIKILDANILDTTDSYSGGITLKSSCFVIKRGSQYLLWEAGFNPDAIKGARDTHMFQPSITETIAQSLEKIGLNQKDITQIAISNMHFDNIGQANMFDHATLYMGEHDYFFLFNQMVTPQGYHPEFINEWADGKDVVLVTGQTDIYGDGTAILIPTPGHTEGHLSLLVNLKNSGSYLLAGDLWHTQENYETGRIPDFSRDIETNRKTMQRVKSWAAKNNVKVIIQHDAGHFKKLPDLPKYLD